jgi:hypothetical protein
LGLRASDWGAEFFEIIGQLRDSGWDAEFE